MTTQCYNERTEVQYFNLLYPGLVADLVSNSETLFNTSQAIELLNWFNPANDVYLSRVDAWQKLLCAGTVADDAEEIPKLLLIGLGILTQDKCNGLLRLTTDTMLNKYPELINKFNHCIDIIESRVKAVHQIAKLFYKFHSLPRKETNMADVKARFSHPGHIQLNHEEIAGMRAILERMEPDGDLELYGAFGPGVSAEKSPKYDRWHMDRSAYPAHCSDSLRRTLWDDNFGYLNRKLIRLSSDFAPSKECFRSEYTYYKYGVTRVAEVPKSLKSNRVVSSEPALGMYCQLALNRYLDKRLHRVFKGKVFLHDQQEHSRLLTDRRACSIDLSDASDHVSRTLVWTLFPRRLRQLLFSARSTFAEVDGALVPLRTFAPMGSGICFTVLTLITLAACSYVCEFPFRAFGDDIIVYQSDYYRVIDLLTRMGLVINTAKSCCTGDYRESCGREIFCNKDVTPVMIRDHFLKVDCFTIEDQLRRLQAGTGYDLKWMATRCLLTSACLARFSLELRWNSKLQRWERGYPAFDTVRSEKWDDYARYRKTVSGFRCPPVQPYEWQNHSIGCHESSPIAQRIALCVTNGRANSLLSSVSESWTERSECRIVEKRFPLYYFPNIERVLIAVQAVEKAPQGEILDELDLQSSL